MIQVGKCPYVQRIGRCYVKASCQFCNYQSILNRFVNAPEFTPGQKSGEVVLEEVDLDARVVDPDTVYRRVKIPGAQSSLPDYSANLTAASKHPPLPAGMSFMPQSFDKSNFTVKGTDGKVYSAAAQFLENMGGGDLQQVEEVKEMEEVQNLNTYFYEYCQDCTCCKGLVYNCRGMQTGDVSCISQCFCLTELQHGMNADY